MAICPMTNKCRFFTTAMADSPEAADKVRQFYCYERFQRCARYVYVRMTDSPPVEGLLPNSLQKVSELFGWGLK